MRIEAHWIWTGSEPPFPGAVTVTSGRIASIERREPRSTGAATDGRVTLLTVGLANAHVHLDLTLPRPDARLEGPFGEWLAGVVETRRALGREGLERRAAEGVAASIAAGTTLLLDYDPAGWSHSALSMSPVRRVLFREVIALTPEAWRSEERGRASLETFLDGPTEPDRELRAIAPHAPYSVHPALWEELVGRADRDGLPWSTHVAETCWERELLSSGGGEGAAFLRSFGSDPAAYAGVDSAVRRLDAAGLLSERALLVHGNHLDDDEIDRIARCGAAVAYCPRSTAYFGHPPHPFPRLVTAGIPVLLGTDGAISAGDLSMLEEMRAARAAAPEVTVEIIWRAVTELPRRFLGGRFGRGVIAEGEPADLVLWEFSPAGDEPLAAVLDRGRARTTWIDGAPTDGQSTGPTPA